MTTHQEARELLRDQVQAKAPQDKQEAMLQYLKSLDDDEVLNRWEHFKWRSNDNPSYPHGRLIQDVLQPPLSVDMKRLFKGAMKRLGARASGREKPIELPWDPMAKYLGGGLWPGLYVLVGTTGSGKTQWALQVALHAAKAKTPVVYIALELDEFGIACRLLGFETELQWGKLYHGDITPDEMKACTGAEAKLAALPLSVIPAPARGWKFYKLNAAAREMRQKHPDGPFLVVLDFLQLVSGDERDDLRKVISEAAYSGREIARDMGGSVLMISSTARTNYSTLDRNQEAKAGLGTGDPGRLVGLGKESGDIEFGADGLFVLGKQGDQRYLALAKNRSGITGWFKVDFDGGRFSNVGEITDWYQPAPGDTRERAEQANKLMAGLQLGASK